MEMFKACTFVSLLIFLSSFPSLGNAVSPAAGTIERAVKQQVLASLPPDHEASTPTSGSSQILFLTSPLGKYSAYLLRRQTAIGAGGFGNDFCYIQVQEADNSVWESECALVSNVNTCTLLFSDAGLEIYDGSRSSWNTDADGDNFQRLDLLDAGDMQIRDQDGELGWKASDEPNVNQNCGSIGSPGLTPALPPFAQPISQGNTPFGQSTNGQGQQPPPLGLGFQQQQGLGIQQQQQQQQQSINQPIAGFNQPFSNPLSPPFATNNNPQGQGGLVDNTPFDSGVSRENLFNAGLALVSLISLMAAFTLSG